MLAPMRPHRALLLASLLTACVSPPRSQAPPPKNLFDTSAGVALGPPRVAQPPSEAADFDDPGRMARAQQTLGAIDAHFNASMAEQGFVGLAVAVVVDGQVVMSKGYGDRDGHGGAIDGDTVFRIGSITKVVSAMALLALRDQGKLSLDDPAAKYVPELSKLVYPTSDSAPITLRQLISHDAGLPRLGSLDVSAAAPSEADLRQSYDGFRLQQAPGLGPHYSNVGVGSLGLVIQHASGKPYRDYVGQQILAPLGLTSAAWEASAVVPAALALAHGDDGKPIAAKAHWQLGPTEAAGGLYLSANDLAKLVAFHLSAWPPRNERDTGPVRRASLRESHRIKVFEGVRARLKGADAAKQVRTSARGTGFAWQVEQSCKLEHLVWHNGGTEGYRAVAFLLPQRGVAVVALSNGTKSPDTSALRALHMLIDGAKLDTRKDKPSARLAEAMDVASTLLERGNINEPDYLALFAPAFRRQVPLIELRELAASLRARHGGCKRQRWVEVGPPDVGRARFHCQDGSDKDVLISLESATPQLVAMMLIQDPAPPNPERDRCRQD
jgi:CubicO group peptidase (beta-lactamase class C family)